MKNHSVCFALVLLQLIFFQQAILPVGMVRPQTIAGPGALQREDLNRDLFDFLSDQLNHDEAPPEQALQDSIYQEGVPGVFYRNYLMEYYPKALTIRQLFRSMTFDEMIGAINDIVIMLTEEPLDYFLSKEMQIRSRARLTHYWEFIVDQLSLINYFLKRCSIADDGSVLYDPFVDQIYDAFVPFDGTMHRVQALSFFDSLDYQSRVVIDRFYALAYDYIVKLFNEGILIGDSTQANRYLREEEFLMKKLRGSIFEIDYKESVKTSKELLSLLRQEKNHNLALYDQDHALTGDDGE